MFNFDPSFDIGHDDYNEIIISVNAISREKFKTGAEWPLFKVWFTIKIGDFGDTDKVNLEDFVNSFEVNRFPRRFSNVVEAMIKAG